MFKFLILAVFMVSVSNAYIGPKFLQYKEQTCPSHYVLIAGNCFRFYQRTASWTQAESICDEDGADLASVKTGEEYTQLLGHINNNYAGQYWLGGKVTNGKWMWMADRQIMNNDWFGRTPASGGNFCSYFCSFTRKYWDGNCDGQKKFICELQSGNLGNTVGDDEVALP